MKKTLSFSMIISDRKNRKKKRKQIEKKKPLCTMSIETASDAA